MGAPCRSHWIGLESNLIVRGTRCAGLRFRFRALFRGKSVTKEIDEELRLHVERQVEENIVKGMSPGEARRAALLDFGAIDSIREECWDARKVNWIQDLLQDVRYGARSLKKSPSFTAIAVLTLAIGIGANATIFGFADLLLRRPVVLKSLDRLVAVSEQKAGEANPGGVSLANFMDLRRTSTTLEHFSAYQYWSATLTGQGQPVEIRGNRVTADFFQTVAATPSQGRIFLEAEDSPGQNFSIILSDAFWRRVFHGDPAVLGKNLELDGSAYIVVGIMPPTFKFPLGAEFWTPLVLQKVGTGRGGNDLSVIGSLRAGVTADRARLELNTIWTRLQRQYPRENSNQRLTVFALRDWIVDQDSRQFVWFLVGVVGFVLLIVCANVANLQFARAAGRQREIAVRTSLGANRFRLLRQFLTESVLLAGLGALFGLLLAAWGLGVMRATLPAQVREICDVDGLKLNSAALFFTLGLAALTGVLSGIAPAWQSTNTDPNLALKETGGRSGSGRGHRLRDFFVVSEVTLALILLIGAALMIKGFVTLAIPNANIGAEKLLTFHVSLPETRYPSARQLTDFYIRAVDRLKVTPGVHLAAAISGLPYSFYEDETSLDVEGEPTLENGQLPTAMQETVSSEYFRTMGIQVLEGRTFESRDSESALPVAVVSHSMVKRIWNNSDPIGKRFRVADVESQDWITVIGVVGDTRHEVYDRGFRSILYRPLPQAPPRSADFVLRSSDNPTSLLSAMRIEIAQLDKDLAIEQAETVATKIQGQAGALRFVSVLMGIFGIVALVLCAMGVYGIVANSVTERQREIGIRMALGARPFHVLKSVAAKGMSLVLVGLGVGLVASLALAHVLANLFYGVAAWDALTFSEIPGLLVLMAVIAVYIPTRRAVGLDPVTASKQE